MLVLTRKEEDALLIMTPSGEIIRVAIKDIKKHSVRLSIEAAKDVRVLRHEIVNRYCDIDTSNLGTKKDGLPRPTRSVSIDAQVDGQRLADI